MSTTTARPVPTWIRRIAWLVPVIVLPSAIYRLGVLVYGPACVSTTGADVDTSLGWGESSYVVLLSVVSMGAACLSFGLVQGWGERVPRWLVVSVAGAAVAFLAVTTTWQAVVSTGAVENPFEDPTCVFPESGPERTLIIAAYLPVTLWSPLLAILTVHHHRRRSPQGAADARLAPTRS